MSHTTKINDSIYRLTTPYKDIYTTVYIIKASDGVFIFDSASFDDDAENYILPALSGLGIAKDDVKYVFISHNHKDHSGGLDGFMKHFPKCTIISRSPALKERFDGFNVIAPQDNDAVTDELRAVTIPGHTEDSCAIYDTRTKTLISGDCLQLYGIFGSGKWASNISLVKEHIEAVDKLRNMDIEHILTAHDYHPYGYSYVGKDAVGKALDACVSPLYRIRDMILANPDATDAKICGMYNCKEMPNLGEHVVAAVRSSLCC